MFEVKKRSALGLTCKCHNPYNFRRTKVQGFLEVDVAGYGARRNQYLKNPMRSMPRNLRQAADDEYHADVSYGKKKPHQARLPLEELEGSSQHHRSSDPLTIDDRAKQVELKVLEVRIQNNNLRKNVSQKRSLQDTSMHQLRIFDSDDLSRSNKKTSSPDVQEETITNKQKKRKTIDSMVARKKVVDNQYSDLLGDQIS
ncbi:UNVERIFIED_CONTAM: hypothetical protein Slati_2741200 [Sesamum latifolium]|uniref:Uncharacterized protein n=1 Tax=Sesamum latifolium TaxID=2727402 RepID=A0AAW2VYJ2_9LAMI